MIPKRIYYVWIGNKPISQSIRSNIKNWKSINPQFEIKKIDESNFDIERYPFIRDAYHTKNWAFASDLMRLIVIFENGGFYFDTDVHFRKSIESLCSKKSVWGMEAPGRVDSGLVLGAQKNDDDLNNIINIYNHLQFDHQNVNKMITTDIISTYFRSKGLRFNNKLQILENGTTIFPSPFFAPYHWWGGGHISDKTIAIQQYSKQWGTENKMSKFGKFSRDFYFYFPKTWLAIRHMKRNIIK